METLGVVSGAVIATLALIGALLAVVRNVYHRGGQESNWEQALNDNTASNKELTGELRQFKDQTVERLHGLDTRVTVLEKAK